MLDLVIWKGLAVTRRNRAEHAKAQDWPKPALREMQRFAEKARRKVKALENIVFKLGAIE